MNPTQEPQLQPTLPSEPETKAKDVSPTSPPSEPEAPARDVSPTSSPTESEAQASGPTSPKLTPAEAEALARAILAMCFPSEPEAQARDVSPTSPPSEPEAQASGLSIDLPTPTPPSEPEAPARTLHPTNIPTPNAPAIAPTPASPPPNPQSAIRTPQFDGPQSSNSIRNPHSATCNRHARHGLTAVNPAVTRSEKIRFNKFRRAMLDEIDPHSMIEQYLTDQIVLHRWKILQCDAAEAAVMRAAVYRDQHPAFNINDGINPKLGELKYNLAQLNTPAKRSDRNDYFLKLGYNAPELDKIHRYRKEHERALDRALKEWDNCRVRRADQSPCEPTVRRPHLADQPSRAHRPKADFTKRIPSPIDASPDESTTCVRSDPRATQPELTPNTADIDRSSFIQAASQAPMHRATAPIDAENDADVAPADKKRAPSTPAPVNFPDMDPA